MHSFKWTKLLLTLPSFPSHSCYRMIIRWHSHILTLLTWNQNLKNPSSLSSNIWDKIWPFLQFLKLWKFKTSLPQPPPWEPEAYKLIDRIAADEGRFTNNNEVREIFCIKVSYVYFYRWSSTRKPDRWRWTRKESILPSETKALVSHFSQSRWKYSRSVLICQKHRS